MSLGDAKTVRDDPAAFRQQVRMAAVQVAGLRPDELAVALAYEVEPFSGVPAAEAEVSYSPVVDPDPAVRVYDVAVRRRRRRAGIGAERLLVPAMAAGAALLAAAAVDFGILAYRTHCAERSIAERAPLDAQLRRVDGAARANREEARRLREARERSAAAQDRVERLRAAYPSLMDAVAGVCGGRMVVKSFASDGPFAVVLRAVAVSAQDAGEAMAQLTRAAAGRGWRVEPGGISSSAQGTTAEFTCRIALEGGEGGSR